MDDSETSRIEPGRRSFVLGAAAAASMATQAGAQSANTPAKRAYKRIATEEGFTIPEVGRASARYMETATDEPGVGRGGGGGGRPGLTDWKIRLAEMDRDGIDTQILLQNAPGVQIFSAAEGTALATLINDRATEEAVRKYPGRFALLATLAPQDPNAAARELERAVTKLGAKGGIINGHTKGEYLDEPKFLPIWEAAAALDVPIYIHPRDPSPQMIKPYQKYNLAGPMWGYAAEVSLHALRLILSGHFDRFPNQKVVIGHAGENIPFVLDRIDNRYNFQPPNPKLKRLPSDYFKANFVVTSSGINWSPAVKLMQEVLGPDKVLFAVDYPFEDQPTTIKKAEAIPMTPAQRKMFFQTNAERVFKLT